MKRIFLIISLFALIFASCGEKEYQINGTLVGVADEHQVIFLKESMNKDALPFDSIQVENGKFTIKGIADGKALFLHVGKQAYYPVPVMKEAGIIDFIFNPEEGEMYATGTKLNDDNKAFEDSINLLTTEGRKIYETERDKENFKERMDIHLEKTDNLITRQIEKYAPDAMAEYLFLDYVFSLSSPAKKLDILNMLSADFRNQDRIKKLEAALKEDLETQPGTQFVDFQGETQKNEPVSLSDFAGKGKITVVDFWASWCGPCLRSMPALKELYETYKGKNVEVLGVSFDQDKSQWLKAVSQHSLPWNHMVDTLGFDGAGAKYGVQGIPYLLLLDGDGKIVLKGTISVEDIKEEIEELLK